MSTVTKKQEWAGKRSLKFAVGYVRVSTKQQGETGMSLELQKEAITTYTSHAGFNLVEIFEDVASGKGDTSFYRRKGLQSALDLAKAQDAVLVVCDWSRLSRSSQIEKQIIDTLGDISRVVSVKEKNTLNEAAETAVLRHNERFAKEISRRTREGMAKKRIQGAIHGNPDIKTDVQPRGVAANAAAAERLVHAIAEVLRRLDDPFGCSLKQVADALNQIGLRTGQNGEWTTSRAREPVKKARQLLKNETVDTSGGEMSYADDERYGAF